MHHHRQRRPRGFSLAGGVRRAAASRAGAHVVVGIAAALVVSACSAGIVELSSDDATLVETGPSDTNDQGELDREVDEGNTADSGSSTGDDAAASPDATLSPDGPFMPFTGRSAQADSRIDQPALAVRIDNVRQALPQRGLHEADVVVENLVEGGLTRLLAVYHTSIPPSVGPVRSARSTDIDLLANFSRPGFVYWSSNTGVAIELDNGASANKFVDLGIDFMPLPYYREAVAGRAFEQTGYVRLAEVAAGLKPNEQSPVAVFDYAPDDAVPPTAVASAGTAIDWGGGQDVSFVWSDTAQAWLRSQWGVPHLDDNAHVLAPQNVVVLVSPYVTSTADEQSPQAITVGQGPAMFLMGGAVVDGTWSRPDAASNWYFTDSAGGPIRMHRGQTWIELVPADSVTLMTNAAASELRVAAEEFLDG